MSRMLLPLLGVLPLLLASQVQAQLTTFYIQDVEAVHDDVVELDLSVANFRTVAAAQLSLQWDAEALEFLSVSQLALGASETGNFNLRQSATGQLAYTFIDPALEGYDLEDGSALYRLQFRVLAQAGEEIEISFGEHPTRCVVGDPQGQEMDAQFVGGLVRVLAGETELPAEVQLTVQPNPFSTIAQLQVTLDRAISAEMRVYDLRGRLLIDRTIELSTGSNQLQLSGTELPAAGTYLIEVSGEELLLHKKVVFTGG